jgi:1-hydroxy-2-naphthoate dioxygenase
MSKGLQSSSVDRDDFHRLLSQAFLRGQWQNETAKASGDAGQAEIATGLVGPKPGGEPHLWQWSTVRSFLETSCEIVPEAFTARRSILFNNPGLAKGTTTTINMGIQMIRSGELAWAHRHSISALRFVTEGHPSLCTVVNGEKCPMSNYDLVLTPAWTWHDHHNGAAASGIWLDVLDGPVVGALNQIFFENFGAARQPLADLAGETLNALRPPENVLPRSARSGAAARICFPWREVEPQLFEASQTAGSPYDGAVLEYFDPETGNSVLPVFSCWAQMLRPGEATKPHRHTSSAVYFVVRGRGRTIVGDKVLEWAPNDCFALPNWSWHEHRNLSSSAPAVLFSVNDVPLVRFLGLYREEPEISISRVDRAMNVEGGFMRAP